MFARAALPPSLLILLATQAWVAPLRAQDGSWDDDATRSLVTRAQALRSNPLVGGKIDRYKSEAEGHIYFYLDREDGGDPIPMRVDQVAVDLYWKHPDSTRQEILEAMRHLKPEAS